MKISKLNINCDKTKVMVFGKNKMSEEVKSNFHITMDEIINLKLQNL